MVFRSIEGDLSSCMMAGTEGCVIASWAAYSHPYVVRAIYGNHLPLFEVPSDSLRRLFLMLVQKYVDARIAAKATSTRRISMSNDDIAAAVLECVGGFSNVTANSLCATRLRISLRDLSGVDRNALNSIKGVLGIADRGTSGIEVVFGPNLVKGVFRSFERLTGLLDELGPHEDPETSSVARPTGNFQVKITPETPGRPQVQSSVARPSVTPKPVEDDDTNSLLEMLESGLVSD